MKSNPLPFYAGLLLALLAACTAPAPVPTPEPQPIEAPPVIAADPPAHHP